MSPTPLTSDPSVGSVLVIPVSVLVDWLVHDYILDWEAILGTVGILCGFFLLVFSETWEMLYWEKRLKEPLSSHLDIAERKLPTSDQITTTRKWKPVLYYII